MSLGSAVLTVKDLTVRFGTGKAEVTAVRDVSLVLGRGETLGVVGESGSGKSTLAKAVSGVYSPSSGTIDFPDSDALPRHRLVQMVFQNPYASLNPRMTVRDALSEAVSVRDGDRGSRDRAVAQLMDAVELSGELRRRYPHEMSGGQRQRVALARALAVRPKVLILDEATSSLDVSVQHAMLATLKELQGEYGFSSLFISHDLAVVQEMCERVAVMYLGRVIERACVDALYAGPRHPYTQVLLASAVGANVEVQGGGRIGEPADPRRPPPGCGFHPRCPWGPSHRSDRTLCRESDPALQNPPDGVLCHFPLEEFRFPAGDTG